jgi:hypothetical protein
MGAYLCPPPPPPAAIPVSSSSLQLCQSIHPCMSITWKEEEITFVDFQGHTSAYGIQPSGETPLAFFHRTFSWLLADQGARAWPAIYTTVHVCVKALPSHMSIEVAQTLIETYLFARLHYRIVFTCR